MTIKISTVRFLEHQYSSWISLKSTFYVNYYYQIAIEVSLLFLVSSPQQPNFDSFDCKTVTHFILDEVLPPLSNLILKNTAIIKYSSAL